MTFILCSEDNSFNWIYGAISQSEAWKASNRLWGGNLNNETSSKRLDTKFTGKTIYDPCPSGWCMPLKIHGLILQPLFWMEIEVVIII